MNELNKTRIRGWRPMVIGVGLVAVGLFATACSSDDSKTSAPATTATSGAGGASGAAPSSTVADVFGAPKPATGSTVKLGYITDGKGQAVDNSTEVPAAQAAVKYANDYLGGIGGHKIELDVCDDKQTPSGTSDCDNQLIADKVPVVLNNTSGSSDPLIKNVEAAGIPFISYQTGVQAILSSKDASVLTNGLGASFAAPAKMAQNSGAKRGAVFVIDVPSLAGPVRQLMPIIWKNAGIPVDIVPIAPGVADMTPQAQAELAKKPDLIEVLGDVTFCSSALKALKTLGYSKTLVIIPQCVTSTSAAGIPGGYTGMLEATVYSNDPTDAENQLYKAAMTKYSSGTDPYANGVTSGGWAVVLGAVRALTGLTGDITPASVKAALAAMPPTPVPLAPGLTFQCNGKQIAITPAACSTGVLQTTLNQAGLATGGFKPLDVSDLLKLG